MKIPNIVHFIYIDADRGFGLCNWLAILSASVVQRPETIFLHYDRAPEATRWWEEATRYVSLVPMKPPEDYEGMPLRFPQHQADVLRLQILQEHGGIYLDTDVLLLKPLDPLRAHGCVLGGESYKQGGQGQYTRDLDRIGSITNAVLMAEPNHPFIARLLEEMPRRFRKSDWAYHAVVLAYEMARTHRDLIHVEPVESFMPFDFRTDELFRSAEKADLDALFARTLNRSYCIHLWETIWRAPFLNRIDENYLARENTLFAHLFRGYLFHLQSPPASTRTNADLRR